MVDAIQVQRRRGTRAQCNAMIPAEGEIIFNTTDNRIHIGDGFTAGGIPLPNAQDIQYNPFKYAVAGGTANALTASFFLPITSYTAGLKVVVKASSDNTGPVTLDAGPSADDVEKMTSEGLTALSGGEQKAGGIYEYYHDGTRWIILNPSTSENTGNAPINTYSIPSPTNNVDLALPSSYCEYEVIYDIVTEATGTHLDKILQLRASSDGGSSFYSGSSDYEKLDENGSNNSTELDVDSSSGENHIVLGEALSAASSNATRYTGSFKLVNMAGSNNNKLVTGQSVNVSGARLFYKTFAIIDRTEAINEIRIKLASANMASGSNFYVFGKRSS